MAHESTVGTANYSSRQQSLTSTTRQDNMEDSDWDMEEDPQALARYQRDGQDLSPAVNQGQRIVDLRSLTGMSVAKFASVIGLPEKDLLAIEAGMMHLTPAQAEKIAAVLDVSYTDVWVADER